MASHHITSTFISGMAFTTELNGFKITTDSNENNESEAKGPRPKGLMLVSLAGCTGIDVVAILTKMRVPFSDFTIDISGQLTDTEPKTYNYVKLTYRIKVKEEDQSKVDKAVSLSQDKYCGVSAMFRSFATLETEIIYN